MRTRSSFSQPGTSELNIHVIEIISRPLGGERTNLMDLNMFKVILDCLMIFIFYVLQHLQFGIMITNKFATKLNSKILSFCVSDHL